MINEPILEISPHIKEKRDVRQIMLYVIIALIPSALAGIYFFGIRALTIILTCIASCVFSEFVIRKLLKREFSLYNLSAVVTGLIAALIIPSTTPIWMTIIACVFAIVIVKEFFGGLGKNIFNPAACVRVFLMSAWPSFMNSYVKPDNFFSWHSVDSVTSATPLTVTYSLANVFWGKIPGSIGETSAFAILIGGFFLLAMRVIRWEIPVSFIVSSFILAAISGENTLYYIFSGGLLFGAFFMATDYVTTPNTLKGRTIFGVGLAILTFVIRKYGSLPEGVAYSILIMNAITPLIDGVLKPRVFGKVETSE